MNVNVLFTILKDSDLVLSLRRLGTLRFHLRCRGGGLVHGLLADRAPQRRGVARRRPGQLRAVSEGGREGRGPLCDRLQLRELRHPLMENRNCNVGNYRVAKHV